MTLHYDKETKTKYMDDAVADKYHQAFASSTNLRNARFRVVARKERETVRRLLLQVKHERILDIPAGTGKLAPVFIELGADITACDISENMLQIARDVYERSGYTNVSVSPCDATEVSAKFDEKFDVVVCLRLMHRVPRDVRATILEQLSKVANYAVVSFGAETAFHRLRRSVRNMIFGGGVDSLCYEKKAQIEEELKVYFNIEDHSWILPYLSQEIVYLLKPKDQ